MFLGVHVTGIYFFFVAVKYSTSGVWPMHPWNMESNFVFDAMLLRELGVFLHYFLFLNAEKLKVATVSVIATGCTADI